MLHNKNAKTSKQKVSQKFKKMTFYFLFKRTHPIQRSPAQCIDGSSTCDEPSFIVALFYLAFKAVSHLRVRACEKKRKSKP